MKTHIIETQQFERDWMENELFPEAKKMEDIVKAGGTNILSGKRMVSFFYEPSTRTRASFEMAMDFLGGKVVFSTDNAKEFSSLAKGETIEDTMQVLSGYYPDVIIIRTDEEGLAARAAKYAKVPVVNAGDGPGQHPTQALLDIYTIKKEKGEIAGISIVMCGDLARGRTARSLSYLLAKYPGVKLYFVSPEVLRMRDDIKEYLIKHNVEFVEVHDLRTAAPKADVIYQTRTQKERSGGDFAMRYGSVKKSFTLDLEILDLMKEDAIIMHPLPRNDELSSEVDSDPRAAYFRQAENGLYVRMALLKLMLT